MAKKSSPPSPHTPFQKEGQELALPSLPFPHALLQHHDSKITPLRESFFKQQKIHHALLFTGLEGIGKKEMALELVRQLFCDAQNLHQTSSLHTSCTCASCLRAQQGQWLDLEWINDYSVERFRELKSKMGYGPTEEPLKAVIIPHADQMKSAAANSILKTLEEPPANWLFILTTSDSARLLPTLRSRCMEIKFTPLPATVMMDTLKESLGTHFNERKAQFATRASLGSLNKAYDYMSDEVLEMREQILGLFSHPAQEWSKLIDLFSTSSSHWKIGTEILISILSDLQTLALGLKTASWINEDQKSFLTQWYAARSINLTQLQEAMTHLHSLVTLQKRPLNAKLFAQEALIPVLNLLIQH